MIGIPGSKDIVFGYEVAKWETLNTAEQAALKQVEKELQAFLGGFATKILDLKKTLRERKQDLENAKNKQYGKLGESKDFAAYLMKDGGYVEQLRQLGMSLAQVKRQYDPAGLKAVRDTLDKLNGEKLKERYRLYGDPGPLGDKDFWELKLELETPEKKVSAWKSEPGVKVQLVKLITNPAEGYTSQVTRHARVTYRKKLTADDPEGTEYVKDDDDVFTRRYAVMYKTQDFINLLLEKGNKGEELQGKFMTRKNPGSFTQVQPFEAGRNDKDPWLLNDDGSEKKAGDPLTLRQALHVHQELGSRDSARGACLTSISLTETASKGDAWKSNPKVMKTMYSNSGEQFQGKRSENQLVLIDFAQVPTGQQLLYNLYRPDAQAKAQAVGIVKPQDTRDETFFNNEHMLNSVTKNREIFLRVVKKDFVVNWSDLKAKK